jgi:protein TonB
MAQSREDHCARTELFEEATAVSRPQSWLTARFGTPRLISIGIHGALVTVALIPWASRLPLRPKLNETAVILYTPSHLEAPPRPLPDHSKGGGGGGKRELLPASRGVLPRGADRQLAPPDPEPPKNPDPTLVVEPTIVAPDLASLRPLNLLDIGDPRGVIGPPSSGPGKNGGIGNGDGRGDGDGSGPGGINGSGGGCCEGPYRAGGGISAPTVVYRVEPEYSEEARKARRQGTVMFEAVIRKDGRIDVVHIVRGLGFGLDQSAIEALKAWRFLPGRKNGVPVDVQMNIEVTFNIR